MPITSQPWSKMGHTCAWMGVGAWKPAFFEGIQQRPRKVGLHKNPWSHHGPKWRLLHVFDHCCAHMKMLLMFGIFLRICSPWFTMLYLIRWPLIRFDAALYLFYSILHFAILLNCFNIFQYHIRLHNTFRKLLPLDSWCMVAVHPCWNHRYTRRGCGSSSGKDSSPHSSARSSQQGPSPSTTRRRIKHFGERKIIPICLASGNLT